MTRLRSPGYRGREGIGSAPILVCADRERALAVRRCVDELGARPFQRRRRARPRMLRPNPAMVAVYSSKLGPRGRAAL